MQGKKGGGGKAKKEGVGKGMGYGWGRGKGGELGLWLPEFQSCSYHFQCTITDQYKTYLFHLPLHVKCNNW